MCMVVVQMAVYHYLCFVSLHSLLFLVCKAFCPLEACSLVALYEDLLSCIPL